MSVDFVISFFGWCALINMAILSLYFLHFLVTLYTVFTQNGLRFLVRDLRYFITMVWCFLN